MLLLGTVVLSVLLLTNALYVAAEFAAVAVRRGQVRQRSAAGSLLAKRLQEIVDDPRLLDRYIATCQIGITLSSLVLGAFGQIAYTPPLAHAVAALAGWSFGVALSVAAVTVLVALTGLQVVIGELVPKSLALQFPMRASLATVLPTIWSMWLFAPFIAILNGSALGFMRLFRLPTGNHRHLHSPEEIELLVAESREGGLLEPEEHRMLAGALHLRERPVHQLLVPRIQVVAMDVDTPLHEAIDLVAHTRYTRVPVFEHDPTNVIGMIHAKDVALRSFLDQPIGSTRDLVRPVSYVPETLPGDRALMTLRESRTQMVVVQDEHGSAVGILTFEDVLAEMLGEPSKRSLQTLRPVDRLDEGHVRVPGLVPVSRAPAWLQLPEVTDAQTVGGVFVERFGRIPHAGDELVVEGRHWRVERMSGKRIDALVVEAPVGEFQEGPPDG